MLCVRLHNVYLSINKVYKNGVLLAPLIGILLLNLTSWPQFTEASVAFDCLDPEIPSIAAASSYANPKELTNRNYTEIIDFNNGFDNLRELERAFNLTNALASNDPIKNETRLSSNVINQTIFAGNFTGLTNITSPGTSSPEIVADFNNDGFEDQAIGVPQFDLTNEAGVGAVIVIYGSFPFGLSASGTAVVGAQFLTQGWGLPSGPEDQDNFGWSVSAGDYNGDEFADLAIGVPNENFDTNETFATSAGMVHVIYGSPQGLSNHALRDDQIWYQGFSCLRADVADSFEFFGNTLSSGDYNGDGHDDLAVGVPGQDLNDVNANIAKGSGAVHIIYGSPDGLSTPVPRIDQLWTQRDMDIEAEDAYGSSLSSGDYNGDNDTDLAVGVPDEDVSFVEDAGAVHIIHGSPDGLSNAVLPVQIWTQNSGIPDVAEASDHFGRSLSSGDYNRDTRDDLAIGVPYEKISDETIPSAGRIHVIYGSSSGLSTTSPIDTQTWIQGSGGIDDAAEIDDFFGWSLSSGDHNGDGSDDLAIGVPGEDVRTNEVVRNAGAIHVIYGSSTGLSTTTPIAEQFIRQGIDGVNGGPIFDELFGWVLSSGDHEGDGRDELIFGIPWSDLVNFDEGHLQVIHGTPSGLSATTPPVDQTFLQGANGVPPCQGCGEPADNFGWSIS